MARVPVAVVMPTLDEWRVIAAGVDDAELRAFLLRAIRQIRVGAEGVTVEYVV